MKIAAHQPDLLPYSGFWYKMAKADVFDLKIYDQFVERGYQRRVKMRDSWASLSVSKSRSYLPITEVYIDPSEAPEHLANLIRGRYGGSPYFDTRGKALLDLIESVHTDLLWQFNHALILGVRDMLGIRTPVSISGPHSGSKSAGLVETLQLYGGPVTYLSGMGARSYMGDCAEFIEAGIQVEWSAHRPVTGDSIVTVLMDYDDPLGVVLAEGDQ